MTPKQADAVIVKKIIENPLDSYIDFTCRLKKYGANACFPEFEPTVNYLLETLDNDYFQGIIKLHPEMEYELKEVKTMIGHINLKFIFDDETHYPYPKPFNGPYPYRPTLDAIESALRLLDKLNRLDPENKAVPLYHFDRYAYHRHSLIVNEEIVILPTITSLDIMDLVRVRAVPISFIGVEPYTVRVDRHQQSPLDFWYHDINHVRRMYGYIKKREREQGIEFDLQRALFFKHMDDFIVDSLMTNIIDTTDDKTPEDIAIKRLMRVLVFEILHESALTSEKEIIIEEILRPAGPQPFEHMIDPNENEVPEDIEKLRTPTGNLQSGISGIRNRGAVTVRFFHDRALSLLSNVYNKLNYGFYDDPDNINETISAVEFRTPEYILKAVKKLFEILGYKDGPGDDFLMDLILSKEGSAEKFVYKSVNSEKDTTVEQFATEPINADEIIKQIKALNKKIYTLFGFSQLGYNDVTLVGEQIREELKQLNPADTIINIGATEEGIGMAYKIAKELGFQTIGVVSTLALMYSGKFSKYVDRIYIVNDPYWGGTIPGTDKLAETTKIYLEVSDVISAYGGGENTASVLKEGYKLGKNIIFTPAEMNKEVAKSLNSSVTDFNGPAFYAWKDLQNK